MRDYEMKELGDVITASLEQFGKTINGRAVFKFITPQFEEPGGIKPFYGLEVYVRGNDSTIPDYILGLNIVQDGGRSLLQVSGNIHPQRNPDTSSLEKSLKDGYSSTASSTVRDYLRAQGGSVSSPERIMNRAIGDVFKLHTLETARYGGRSGRSTVVRQNFKVTNSTYQQLLADRDLFISLLKHYILGEFHKHYNPFRSISSAAR